MSRLEMMKERMKAQRAKSIVDDSSDAQTLTKLAADEENESESTLIPMAYDGTVEMENEIKQSEKLVSKLQSKHRKVKDELEQDGDPEDVTAMMKDAKQRTKQLLDESPEGAGGPAGAQGEGGAGGALKEDEASESVANTARSLKPRVSITPRMTSHALTLREKMAERMRAAMDKGKEEAYSESRDTTNQKLAGKRAELKATRFDERTLFKDEDDEAEDELEKSLRAKMKDKFKEALKQKKTEADLPTQEEAYDFFTRVWDADDAEKDKEKEKEKEKDEEVAKPGEGEETAEQAAATVIQEEEAAPGTNVPEDEVPLIADDYEESSWMLYQNSRAEYVSQETKYKAEEKMYYVPSMAEAPASRKTFLSTPPRNLEEEGFYVGVRPYVPSRNLHRMENRLLKPLGGGMRDEESAIDNSRVTESTRKWFGEDGRLITLPDPVKQISSRPPIMEDEEPILITPYIKPDTRETKAKFIEGHYQLDIDINTIVFTHHHLFSREHVRASQLVRQYEEYTSRGNKKTVQFLTGKLQALKSAKKHIEQNINAMKTDPKKERTVAEQEQMLRVYTDDIRMARKQKDFEMEADRMLVKTIIRTWKEIKRLRQVQGCTNTSVKLQIRKEPTNQAEDEEEWKQDIAEELEEIQEELADSYDRSMELYQLQLQLWKEQKLRKKDATKRQKGKRRSNRDDGEEVNEEQNRKDQDAINEPDLAKPEKPKPSTDAEARDRVEAKYRQIRRNPGEPNLYLELSNSAVISNTQECSRGEQQRRTDVVKCRIFVKVLFNDKEVSKTTSQPLGQDFVVRFAQIFNIEIMYWPESIKYEIYESSGMSLDLMSTVYAAIPESNATAESSHLVEINFSSDLKRAHSHQEGVGSGVPLSLDSANNSVIVNLTTSGFLTSQVVWAMDAEGNILVPPTGDSKLAMYSAMKGMDAITAIGMSGLGDVAKITKWIEESHLDPNDPSNADILHLMKPLGGGGELGGGGGPPLVASDHFRLEHIQDEFNFVSDEDLEASKRFRLIQLRDQGVEGFKHVHVPAFDREVPDNIFSDYEKMLKAEEKLREADDTDSHHVAVAKFMQKVRQQVMQNCLRMQRSRQYSDIVHEDAVPDISVVLPQLLKLAQPRRDLKPVRQERKKVNAQNLQAMEVKILVNIIRAFGIPVRRTAAPEPPSRLGTARRLPGVTEDLNASGLTTSATKVNQTAEFDRIGRILGINLTQAPVRPFIEVMFQRNIIATSVAEGSNPSWNEEICIPFRPPDDDYSPSKLRTVNDVLYLNLFDECIVDIAQDERQRSTTVHQRIERHWLGSIKIPFSTIYTNGRIDGTFRVSKPPVLLGYAYESRNKVLETGNEIAYGDTEHTYLSMFMTIEPQLATPDFLDNKFDSMETEHLLRVAESWLAGLYKLFPKREYTATVINIEGLSIFVTRYIRALNPPPELIRGEHGSLATAEMVARYVSFIPSVSDSVVFPGFCDIWSTCSQFLQMLQGDEEEHAVLLTNYFLHLGKKAWLLIGSGIPEGASAYVVTQEGLDFWIWCATTGEHFDYRDNYCPVQSVGCLVNDTNVWANIQMNEKPSQISFDLNNTSLWKPFFTKDYKNPGLASIQVDQLVYHAPNKAEVLSLQEKIEAELKRKISEWRPRHITRWNRYCVQAFRRLLIQLEEASEKGVQTKHSAELDQVVGSYKLCGFPINVTYTEMKPLVESVFATGVHEFESNDVEFALAVHIQPYPNTVLSVWIYVASLVRRRA